MSEGNFESKHSSSTDMSVLSNDSNETKLNTGSFLNSH